VVAGPHCTGHAAPPAPPRDRPPEPIFVENDPRGRRHRRDRAVREMAGIRTRVRDPAKTRTVMTSGRWLSSFWGAYARDRIAAQVPAIRHWRVVEGDYTEAPDIPRRGSSTRHMWTIGITARVSTTTRSSPGGVGRSAAS
jgi:hypothetical protein